MRRLDLANIITFIRDRTGLVVFDEMVTAEIWRAAWRFLRQHRGEGRPISTVVCSHTRGDHRGGIRGLPTDEEVRARRRDHRGERPCRHRHELASRLPVCLLPTVAPHCFVTQDPGHGISGGSGGLIAPNRIVEQDIEEFQVDGVPMVFQNTPVTEAPAEMNSWIPRMKALWMAETSSPSCATSIRRAAPVEVHR